MKHTEEVKKEATLEELMNMKIDNKDYILELNEHAIFIDGLDESIVGVQELSSDFVPLYNIHQLTTFEGKGLSYEAINQEIVKRESILERNEQAIFLEDLDEAIVGIQERNSIFVPLYDIDKLADILMEKGLSYEDAIDHVSTNIVYAWIGENTPSFAYIFSKD